MHQMLQVLSSVRIETVCEFQDGFALHFRSAHGNGDKIMSPVWIPDVTNIQAASNRDLRRLGTGRGTMVSAPTTSSAIGKSKKWKRGVFVQIGQLIRAT
jgi:hypothetical protein